MRLNFSRIYVMFHLFAVLALGIAPFVFFTVYADDNQNEWKLIIPNGASNNAIQNEVYPNQLPVKLGDEIIWENEDSVPHSITSGLPKYPEFAGEFFNPGIVEPGKSVSHVLLNSDFNSFYYFCEIHPWLTGNIFVSDIPIAQPETIDPIFTDKNSYFYGDEITVSGEVHPDFIKTDYTLLIYDQNNQLVHISEGAFDEDASYTEIITADGNQWNKNGNNKIKMVYGVPSKVAETTIQLSEGSLSSDYKKSIPTWIKNVGNFWCTSQISEIEFIDAIQFLITEDIIKVEKTEYGISDSQQIPQWVKNNACWWADDKIPDLDFISGIEYLVNIGTISV